MVTVNMTMCRHSSFYLFWLSFSHTYPKYTIGRAACSGLLLDPLGAHSGMDQGGGDSFRSFFLLEINYFPGAKDSLRKCKNQDKLQVKLSLPWHSGHRHVHIASDRSESSFQAMLPALQRCLWPCSPSPNTGLPTSIFDAPPGLILYRRQVPLGLTWGLGGHGWLVRR